MRHESPYSGDVASMHRLTFLTTLALTASLFGCGGKKPAATPTDSTASEAKKGDTSDGTTTDKSDDSAPKKDECSGSEIGNLEDMLLKSSCEAPMSPDSLTPSDLKGRLEVTVAPSPTKVAPGGKADLILSFANKGKDPLTLHFRIDPLPRFDVETLDAKGHRIDTPAGKAPPPPKGVSPPPATEAKVARITIAAGGTARARVPWEAVKTRWAPEKYRGSPPERGFPRTPAGPLPKGKYTLKVVTPLVGASEGPDRETTAPKTPIEIGG